ncbi:enolase C-terminal domain-like protein [Ruania albidiflava]|uniref:enolase C-terminal domain-like protein n=1 Tax=Ruania albidiflava TaxID=366586 RepID=UPI0023F1B9A0|nr:enolase C-terminal domain-like protein [Ruania albidiflava]
MSAPVDPPAGGPVIEALSARAYTIPTDAPEADGTLAWQATTMVVVQAEAASRVGLGWTYGPPACADLVSGTLRAVVEGRDALAVPGTWEQMVRAVRNATRAGVAGYAISAVDVALWDLKARLLGLSLVDLFGAAGEQVQVYGSGGFTSYDDARMVQQLTSWVAGQQIPRVKIKIGQDRGTRTDRDLQRIHRAREAIGPQAELFTDANGAYSAKHAIRLAHAAAEANVTWLEEPVSSGDLPGLHLVREQVTADVTAGEYGSDVGYFQRMCAARAVDCLQVDATRCGGYTEWLRAAAVAQAHELTVSGHCAPHLHAPVAAATPNLRHLEWFHDHVRIENLAFDGVLDPGGGAITPDRTAPGHGLTLRAADLETYRVR